MALAQRERKTRKGRQSYSSELQDAIRAASAGHSKSEISKSTGISFPTLQRIVGPSRPKPGRKGKASKKPRATATTGAVSISITVSLPSGAVLRYDDPELVRKDARLLSDAAKRLA